MYVMCVCVCGRVALLCMLCMCVCVLEWLSYVCYVCHIWSVCYLCYVCRHTLLLCILCVAACCSVLQRVADIPAGRRALSSRLGCCCRLACVFQSVCYSVDAVSYSRVCLQIQMYTSHKTERELQRQAERGRERRHGEGVVYTLSEFLSHKYTNHYSKKWTRPRDVLDVTKRHFLIKNAFSWKPKKLTNSYVRIGV